MSLFEPLKVQFIHLLWRFYNYLSYFENGHVDSLRSYRIAVFLLRFRIELSGFELVLIFISVGDLLMPTKTGAVSELFVTSLVRADQGLRL